ncbi:MAG: Modification methylase DpnIIB [candidate division WS2 bacterium]|nr:Modification methylase DpnIIB [Candidatus Lithacetigena glycinireducens]
MRIINQSAFDKWDVADESVQAIITSPPYYLCRTYSIPDVVIGGDKLLTCCHCSSIIMYDEDSREMSNLWKGTEASKKDLQQAMWCLLCYQNWQAENSPIQFSMRILWEKESPRFEVSHLRKKLWQKIVDKRRENEPFTGKDERKEPELERWNKVGEWIQDDKSTRQSSQCSEGICNGTSSCDGKTYWEIFRQKRACASQKWNQSRQQNSEFGIGSEKSSQWESYLPLLQKAFLNKITCPFCHSNTLVSSNCEHVFEDVAIKTPNASGGQGHKQDTVRGSAFVDYHNRQVSSSICSKCNAFRGQYGREETPSRYVNHTMLWLKEAYRVLKNDGCLFVVLDDKYSGSNMGRGAKFQGLGKNAEYYDYSELHSHMPKDTTFGIKRKSLLLIPERIMIAMSDAGWIIRNKIWWCLTGDTELFVKMNGQYQDITLEELYKVFNKDVEVFIPTVKKLGEQEWVKVKNIFFSGYSDDIYEIKTASGDCIKATGEHVFPIKCLTVGKFNKYQKIRMKKVKDFRVSPNNRLWKYTGELNLNLPTGNDEDYRNGYLIGFFMAEGSFVPRKWELKLKDRRGLPAICKSAMKSNMSVEEYLKSRDNEHKGIVLSCGIDDKTRGYFDNLPKWLKYKEKRYEKKNLDLSVYGNDIVRFVKQYVNGSNCKNKNFTNKIFNESYMLLKGILDGFLCGDGHFDEEFDAYRVGLTDNRKLVSQIQTICNILGYLFRGPYFYEIYDERYKKTYHKIKFSVHKSLPHRRKTFDWIFLQIKSKEKVNISLPVYDLEVEPIYKKHLGNNQYLKIDAASKDPKLAKWNNLYLLGNNIFTHNSRTMPESTQDRFSAQSETIIFATKNPKYYFNLNAVREPVKQNTIQRYLRAFHDGKADDYKKQGGSLDTDAQRRLAKKFKAIYGDGEGTTKIHAEDAETMGSPRARYHRTKYDNEGKKADEMCGGGHIEGGGINAGDSTYREKQRAGDENCLFKNPGNIWLDLYLDAHRQAINELGTEGYIKALKSQILTETDLFPPFIEGLHEDHFAPFSEKLVNRLILCSTKPGDAVLDPFAGSGTTILVAEKLNRIGIGIDLGYFNISSKRCSNFQPRLL